MEVENYQGVCTTMCLLCIELGGGGDVDILLDQLRVAHAIQSIALSSSLPISHILAMHSLVAIYLNLLSRLASIPPLRKHVSHVIRTRRVNAPHLLPDVGFFCAEELCFSVSLEGLLPSCLFDIQVGLVRKLIQLYIACNFGNSCIYFNYHILLIEIGLTYIPTQLWSYDYVNLSTDR